jgi:Xaa-Pro dipeptidase
MVITGIDRFRARDIFSEAGIDALVVCEPEAFQYITGSSIGVAGLFRRAGAGFAIVPADPALPIAAVIGDLAEPQFRATSSVSLLRTHPLWVETVGPLEGNGPIENAISAAWAASRPAEFSRPATFDLHRSLAALGELLTGSGLRNGRIGFDFDFVSANDATAIRAFFSDASVCDGSRALDRLRMVKTAEEIARLRLAVELAEAGIAALALKVTLDETVEDLRRHFRSGVEKAANRRSLKAPSSWEYISIGPEPWSAAGRVHAGCVIKVDVGCIIEGYSSDTSRNFVFGTADPATQTIHDILERAFDAGLSAIHPGQRLADVHAIVTRALEEAGLKGFRRGHFGHGLGVSVFSETWPFISADSEECFETGMVMAFEVPLYIAGVGGFNIEDQLLVTEKGALSMNRLPRSLRSIPAGTL